MQQPAAPTTNPATGPPTPTPVSPSEVRVWDGVEAIPAAIIAAFVVGLPLRLLLPAETRFMLVSISLAVVASTGVLLMPDLIVRPAAWLMKAVAGLALPSPSLAMGRHVAIHTHGGHGTKLAAIHEGGHVAVAKAVGARVHGAEIFPDGSGVTWLTFPRNATPIDDVAVSVAGEVAAGTKRGCASDQAYMRAALAKLPASERAAAKKAGYAKARSTVGGFFFDGGVSSTAAQLLKKGRI